MLVKRLCGSKEGARKPSNWLSDSFSDYSYETQRRWKSTTIKNEANYVLERTRVMKRKGRKGGRRKDMVFSLESATYLKIREAMKKPGGYDSTEQITAEVETPEKLDVPQ